MTKSVVQGGREIAEKSLSSAIALINIDTCDYVIGIQANV
jgi:hypothetical protein